jgi:hypothetical protein
VPKYIQVHDDCSSHNWDSQAATRSIHTPWWCLRVEWKIESPTTWDVIFIISVWSKHGLIISSPCQVDDDPSSRGDFLLSLSKEELYVQLVQCITLFPVSSDHALESPCS